jgi:Icc-related predicted phosphoesterase
MKWLAVSDLHGKPDRYMALFKEIEKRTPPAVLMGGDLFPRLGQVDQFLNEFLFKPIEDLRENGIDTRILAILGNDDPKEYEHLMADADNRGLLEYIPMKKVEVEGIPVVGYPYVHPSPFRLKDWELFDVSRYVDPGCISPLDGIHTTDVDLDSLKFRTMKDDLKSLSGMSEPSETVYLFHSPPYNTVLDMAAIGEQMIDHVPLDPHIGSVAVKEFIDNHQPPVTLHGHVHESFHLTGRYYQRLGKTLSISASGIEHGLVVVTFDPAGKEDPERIIIG